MPELYIDCEDEAFDTAPLSAHGLEGTESDVALAAELVFTDEEGIRALNARTRGKDAVTDVLSYPNFDLGGGAIRGEDYPYDRDEDGRLFLGSIVICRGRAEEQAKEYGHSLRRELYYLAVHGLCHLLGFDHETEEERREMRAREERILNAMGIPREEA